MQPVIVQVGSICRINRADWHGNFKIMKVEIDGVIVEYEYHDAYANSTGQVKIPWKDLNSGK